MICRYDSAKSEERKSRGFTLVEMLMVIIIIGLLAGMMMLLNADASDRAKTARIINDLRALKTAVIIAQHETLSWRMGESYNITYEAEAYLHSGNQADYPDKFIVSFVSNVDIKQMRYRYPFVCLNDTPEGEVYMQVVFGYNTGHGSSGELSENMIKSLAREAREAGLYSKYQGVKAFYGEGGSSSPQRMYMKVR